jgi:hypothetical protein
LYHRKRLSVYDDVLFQSRLPPLDQVFVPIRDQVYDKNRNPLPEHVPENIDDWAAASSKKDKIERGNVDEGRRHKFHKNIVQEQETLGDSLNSSHRTPIVPPSHNCPYFGHHENRFIEPIQPMVPFISRPQQHLQITMRSLPMPEHYQFAASSLHPFFSRF